MKINIGADHSLRKLRIGCNAGTYKIPRGKRRDVAAIFMKLY